MEGLGEVAADVRLEFRFRLPGLLEVEHVVAAIPFAEDRMEPLRGRDGAGRATIWRVEADDGGRSLRVTQGELPDVEAAPVVAGDDALLLAEGIEQTGDVGGDVLAAVVGGVRGRVGVAIAAHVGSDGAIARIGEGRELVPPRIPELGEAVDHDDGKAFARLGDMHRDAVGLDLVVLDSSGHWCAPSRSEAHATAGGLPLR